MPAERLQKILSNAGVASRRRAETLISSGIVRVNGKVAKLGDKADLAVDKVEVNGKKIRAEVAMHYLMVNKPREYISSRRDPQGRKSVYNLVPPALRPKVWTVGRLDFYTEGLVLFTNDGDLTQQLAHPKYEHDKEYEVMLNKEFSAAQLDKLRHGVEIGDGFMTSPAKVRVKGDKIYLTIHEGKKHQIRRMFVAVGLKVKSLRRIRLNKLELGDLASGQFREVTRDQII